MLWTIAVILLILWLLGLVSSYTLGGFIHILLVLAIIIILIRVIQGRETGWLSGKKFIAARAASLCARVLSTAEKRTAGDRAFGLYGRHRPHQRSPSWRIPTSLPEKVEGVLNTVAEGIGATLGKIVAKGQCRAEISGRDGYRGRSQSDARKAAPRKKTAGRNVGKRRASKRRSGTQGQRPRWKRQKKVFQVPQKST